MGAIVSKMIPHAILYLLLALSTFSLFLINLEKIFKKSSNLTDRHHQEIKFLKLGFLLNSLGGFMTGLIGVGLGEVNNYYFLKKNQLSIPLASGNSVFLIALTAFICSIFNVFYFSKALPFQEIQKIYSILIFAIPSVVIGARIGVILAHKIKPLLFYAFVSFLFLGISGLSFYRFWN